MNENAVFVRLGVLLAATVLGGCSTRARVGLPVSHVPVLASIRADTAGRNALSARLAVVRVKCVKTRSEGTAFLHASGALVTAAHVVAGCPANSVHLTYPSGEIVRAGVEAIDYGKDLALLKTRTSAPGVALRLAAEGHELAVGAMVSTWGFPWGYSGSAPMLSVGYFSGSEMVSMGPALPLVRQSVVNGAFNAGNSGGPVFSVESGEVVGVVSNKLLPLPVEIESSLKALADQRSGFIYTRTYSDGREVRLTEGQIVAEVLEFVRGQAQLVVGRAVSLADLRRFLLENGKVP